MLTTFDLDDYIYAALRAGASGFLLKDSEPEELLQAVRVVAGGEALLAPSITRRLIENFVAGAPRRPAGATALNALTDREREVLRLMALGMSNAEIAGDAVHRRADHEDPREPDPAEAQPARPGPGGGVRLRDRPGHAGREATGIDADVRLPTQTDVQVRAHWVG